MAKRKPAKATVHDATEDWDRSDVRALKAYMRRKKRPTYAEIGASMGRTGSAVRSKWYRIRVA